MEPTSVSADLKDYLILKCSLFRGLGREARAEVGARAAHRHVERKEVFFREGQPASVFYLLYSGRVKLFQVDGGGQEVIERLIGPGQFCGWLGLPITEGYPATAMALEPSEALAWEKKDLDELFARHPELTQNALRIQARRLRERDERYRELATLRVAERLALTLLRLVYPHGRRFEDGIYDDVPLSRADLAQLTGTTLFTVSRLLSDWESRGLVTARRGSVRVEDFRGLQGLASDGPNGRSPRRH
ncbi:MAG TPA: Crp/Fnr family transcriptional regulator [Vicinamibacteria bacterium]|nr:Crp/Fnr family transcriptional regulator [Vicinamibacteria bacterium]